MSILNKLIIVSFLILIGGFSILLTSDIKPKSFDSLVMINTLTPTSFPPLPTPDKNHIFRDNFSGFQTLEESPSQQSSDNRNWWLNSGAYFFISNGISKTIKGELSDSDVWRLKYHTENPSETDNGYHPQNIFRLVSRTKWTNFEQSVYYKIDRYILSASSFRQASNGLLLLNRYQDGQTLYYTGLRVDGYAVIKKKYHGTYYTMSYVPILPGAYNRDLSPNLIPINKWIGIKTIVKNLPNTNVSIKLYTDIGKTGNWKLATETTDDGKMYADTPVISTGGYAGIRTDFMDVEFSDYRIEEFNN